MPDEEELEERLDDNDGLQEETERPTSKSKHTDPKPFNAADYSRPFGGWFTKEE